MELWQQIKEQYPNLTNADFNSQDGVIVLKDDADGKGAYIFRWDYTEPLPAGMKVGK